jgi:hypothetical protein
MKHKSVGCLAEVSEEICISSLGVEECINQQTNYGTEGRVWKESQYYLISKHLI